MLSCGCAFAQRVEYNESDYNGAYNCEGGICRTRSVCR